MNRTQRNIFYALQHQAMDELKRRCTAKVCSWQSFGPGRVFEQYILTRWDASEEPAVIIIHYRITDTLGESDYSLFTYIPSK
jgi:hypothetical protein